MKSSALPYTSLAPQRACEVPRSSSKYFKVFLGVLGVALAHQDSSLSSLVLKPVNHFNPNRLLLLAPSHGTLWLMYTRFAHHPESLFNALWPELSWGLVLRVRPTTTSQQLLFLKG